MTKSQLLTKTKEELLALAKRLGLRGISTMRKKELTDKVYLAQARRAVPSPQRSRRAETAADELKRRAVRKRPSDTRRPTPSRPLSAPVDPTKITAQKFAVAPPAPPSPATAGKPPPSELPESYGTARLFLTARDPHWLYAYWDLSVSDMNAHRQKAVDGRLVLRLFEEGLDQPLQEITLQSESRNWYIFVNRAGSRYHAQLGYWQRRGGFKLISQSRATATPADAFAADQSAQFVTIPIDVPFQDLYGLVQEQIQPGEELAGAIQRLQAAGHDLPFPAGQTPPRLSGDQTAAVTHLVWHDLLRRAQAGSVEISEWLRRRLSEELSSGVFSGMGLGVPSGSWQVALGQPQQGFWFAVNAELILYGATEPGAKVTIDGKPIALRHDGTFAFHYVFPDGQYQLPIVAVSPRGDDQRGAALTFTRQTKVQGHVGQVNQPPHLTAPVVA